MSAKDRDTVDVVLGQTETLDPVLARSAGRAVVVAAARLHLASDTTREMLEMLGIAEALAPRDEVAR